MLQEVFGKIRRRRIGVLSGVIAALLVLGMLAAPGQVLAAGSARGTVASGDTATVKIPVSCTAKGLEEQGFLVRLRENVDHAQAMELTLKHAETKEFVLSFTKADVGEYYFTLLQRAGTRKDVVYDATQYWVHISVTVSGEQLSVSSVLWKDGATQKLSAAAFVNTAKENAGGSTGGDGTGDDSNNGSAGDNPGGSTGGDGTGDDSSNGGTGSGDSSNGGTGNGSDGKEDSTGNGSGSGSGSDGNGSSNGSGSAGGTGNGSGSNGSGSASGDSSFWGNGSFWGSSSSTGSTGSSLVGTLVRTGDSAKVLLWIGLFILALACAAGAWRCKKNQEHKINRKDREDG